MGLCGPDRAGWEGGWAEMRGRWRGGMAEWEGTGERWEGGGGRGTDSDKQKGL